MSQNSCAHFQIRKVFRAKMQNKNKLAWFPKQHAISTCELDSSLYRVFHFLEFLKQYFKTVLLVKIYYFDFDHVNEVLAIMSERKYRAYVRLGFSGAPSSNGLNFFKSLHIQNTPRL